MCLCFAACAALRAYVRTLKAEGVFLERWDIDTQCPSPGKVTFKKFKNLYEYLIRSSTCRSAWPLL